LKASDSARTEPFALPAATGKELKVAYGVLAVRSVEHGSNWERIERTTAARSSERCPDPAAFVQQLGKN
jgi:hypothetical protein